MAAPRTLRRSFAHAQFEKAHPRDPGRARGSRNAANVILDQIARGRSGDAGAHAAVVMALSDGRQTPPGSSNDSRILEISRNVSGRDRKVPRDQALADRSDAFLENAAFF